MCDFDLDDFDYDNVEPFVNLNKKSDDFTRINDPVKLLKYIEKNKMNGVFNTNEIKHIHKVLSRGLNKSFLYHAISGTLIDEKAKLAAKILPIIFSRNQLLLLKQNEISRLITLLIDHSTYNMEIVNMIFNNLPSKKELEDIDALNSLMILRSNLKNIIKNQKLNEDDNDKSITSNNFIKIIMNSGLGWNNIIKIYDIFKSKGFKIDLPCLEALIKYYNNHEEYQTLFKKITTDLLTGNICINNILNIIFKNTDAIQSFIEILNNLGRDLSIPLESYHKLLLYDKKNEQIAFNLLFQLKDKPTVETLKISCLQRFVILFDKLCELGIQPDQECMRAACHKYTNIDIISKLFNYKLFVDKQCFFNMFSTYVPRSKVKETIHFLVFCGLNLDQECIDFANKKGGYSLNILDFM